MLLVLISQATLKTDATAISIFSIVQLKIDATATLNFFGSLSQYIFELCIGSVEQVTMCLCAVRVSCLFS